MDSSATLSVIVPLARGEEEWRDLLADLVGLPPGTEVILVRADDVPLNLPAGSEAVPLRQLASTPGRARQMNIGAQQARGHWLWFLHADSRLGTDAVGKLQAFVTEHSAALGFFDLHFRDDGPRLTRLNAWGARVRSRCFHLPFGDQGLVLPKSLFVEIGGYDEHAPYGEDHLLVWAAHARGVPVLPIGAALRTSARRYATNGWLATTARHALLTLRQAVPAWWRLRRPMRP